MGTYFRLYPGVDAMAANGLRYGAQAEIRENFIAAVQHQPSRSGNSAIKRCMFGAPSSMLPGTTGASSGSARVTVSRHL